jgi:L-threonylcarbamoyladenylate synthase
LERAAAILRGGGLVAFPTETVYGLGANALDAAAVRRMFAAKQRPPHNPVIVHVAAIDDVPRVAAEWPGVAAELAWHFWPGPLTLVLARRGDVPDIVTAGGPTVAVRLPAHPLARRLIHAAGVPIAAPSANPSTRISATMAEHVLKWLDGRIELLLDGGPTPGGLESTVLDVTVTPPRLLRPGLVSRGAIEAVIGPISAPPFVGASEPRESGDSPGRSPGLLARHYSPSVPLVCPAGDAGAEVRALAQRSVLVGWLALEGDSIVDLPGVTVVQLSRDAGKYAAQFYRTLHALEGAGVETIVVSLPPQGDEWQAVHDRLRRASCGSSAG